MRRRTLLAILAWLLPFAAAAAAASPPGLLGGPTAEAPDPVALRLAWSSDRGRPGETVALAVVFDIAPGHHVIADAGQLRPIPDFTPFPTRIEVVRASGGALAEKPLYPRAHPLQAGFAAGAVMAFEGRAVAYLPVRIAADADREVALTLTVAYQACSAEICLLPQTATLAAALPVAGPGEATAAAAAELFADFDSRRRGAGAAALEFRLFGWGLALAPGVLVIAAAAGLGGLLLNFTPCVLPLLPIKILGITAAAGGRRRSLALGGATALGILAFWLALGALIAFASGFGAANQLFQYPAVPLAVGLLIASMALGMFGAFSVRLPGRLYAFNPTNDTLPGAFGVGLLAALLSTPCTAPFMGTAAAWAVAQDPATALTAFFAIGAGMGLPYLLLAAAPGLVRWVPRSGPAGELLKQVMGILMLAVAAYFIGVGVSALAAAPPDPPSRLYWWPVALLVAAAGLWAGCRGARLARSPAGRIGWGAVALVAVAAAAPAGLHLADAGPVPWIAYTPERLEAAFAAGRPVVLVFTAEWCLNCKALEQGVWRDRRLAALFERGGAAAVRVDLTRGRPEAVAKLREAGSLTIPLAIVYSPQREEVFRSDFYTVEDLLAALRRADGGA